MQTSLQHYNKPTPLYHLHYIHHLQPNFNSHFPGEAGLARPLGFLPPLILEETLGKSGTGFCPFCSPANSVRSLKETQKIVHETIGNFL